MDVNDSPTIYTSAMSEKTVCFENSWLLVITPEKTIENSLLKSLPVQKGCSQETTCRKDRLAKSLAAWTITFKSNHELHKLAT